MVAAFNLLYRSILDRNKNYSNKFISLRMKRLNMQEREIKSFIDNGILIIDTNVPLYLYKCSFNTSQNLVQLLNKVKDKVVIPWQVYQEYLRHKHTEQAKIDQKYDNFTKELQTFVSTAQTKIGKAINQSRKYDFPNCDELESDIQESIEEINNTIRRYGNSLASEKSNKDIQITSVEQLVNYWNSNGKILNQISIPELLETIKEGEIRFRYKMPPGYMDESEKDKELQKKPQLDNFYGRVRKFGDLFVWKEIIKVGIANSDKKIVFITNDVKEDWWDSKQGNGMRSELYNEFVTITHNESIEFMTLDHFYELFSRYYQIQDTKTQMEISMDEYAQKCILEDYEDRIKGYVENSCAELDSQEICSEFSFGKCVEHKVGDLEIENVAIHFDEEAAHYEIAVGVNVEMTFLTDNNSLLGKAELMFHVNVEVQRDFLETDEKGISIKNATYEISDIKNAWEVYLDYEAEAEAYALDAYEEEHRH